MMMTQLTKTLNKLAAVGALVASSTLYAATPQLLLLSDDLTVCSSETPKSCTAKTRKAFAEANKKQPAIYMLTDEALIRLTETPWAEQGVQQKAVEILTQAKAHFADKAFTQRQLERYMRSNEFTVAGSTIKGRDFWFNLFEFEQRNIFDLLEQKQATRYGKRLATEVNFKETRNWVAKKAWQTFFRDAQKIAGKKRKPRVVFVTGGARDPYAQVDYYQELFKALGFDAQWLPINAALQSIHNSAAGQCDKLAEQLLKKQGSYRREVLYSDLFSQQQAVCKKPQKILDLLRKADALFFADANPLLLAQAFHNANNQPTELLKKTQQMLEKGQLLVAAQGRAVNALVGGENNATILSGEGAQVFEQQEMVVNNSAEVCSIGMDCLSAVESRELSYMTSGVLNLFKLGTIDTQTVKKGRQPRLIKTGTKMKSEFIFGLANNTFVQLSKSKEKDQPQQINFAVFGEGGLWLADLRQSNITLASAMQFGPFDSYWLTHEDILSMRNGLLNVEFAPWKQNANAMNTGPTVNSSSPFSRNNYHKLEQMQCNTGATTAQGTDKVNGKQYELQLSSGGSGTMRKGNLVQNGKSKGVCSFTRLSTQILPK